MSKKEFFILFFIIAFGFLVRLYKFDAPIADWHSWRQVDTSSVSRDYAQKGINLLYPTYHDLSNVPSGLDNPEGFRFVEFPIYNVLQAAGFVIFNTFSLEQWGRIISIIASSVSTFFLFLIVRRHADSTAAIFASFFFSFLPFNIYFGRTILSESSMVAALLGGIYFFDRAIERNFQFKISNLKFINPAIICIAAAFLLKPYALFFTLPLIYLAFVRFGLRMFLKWELWLFAIATIVPLMWWRVWIMQYPEGIPASNWLFNGGNIRFKGSYFYWIFADRIGKLILGYWGLGIFIAGLIARIPYKSYGFFLSFLVSSLLYLVVIARGNVQHDYYQILIVPSLCIFLGLGVTFFLQSSKQLIIKPVSYVVIVLCMLFSFSFGWYFVRDYYNINNPAIITAGEAVDRLTPKNSKVIALYDGDTTFLYQTKRKGWASLQNDLPVMIKKGAQYLVIANPSREEIAGFTKEYNLVDTTASYLLVKLSKTK